MTNEKIAEIVTAHVSGVFKKYVRADNTENQKKLDSIESKITNTNKVNA
jgi:hypothetical protein